MKELFSVIAVESKKSVKVPEQPDSVLATKCKSCGATFPKPRCVMPECMCCESKELEQMQWHDYVLSLKKYSNRMNSEMREISDDLKNDYNKTLNYIHAMTANPDFDSTEAMICFNRGAGRIVSEFEDRLWDD